MAYRSLVAQEQNRISSVLHSFSIAESAVQSLFDFSQGSSARHKSYMQSRDRNGRKLADLRLYHQIHVPSGTDSARLCDALNALPFVEIALPAIKPYPIVNPSAEDVDTTSSLTTPDFTSLQYHLHSPKLGVPAVRHLPGADGSHVSIADVEFAWNLDHEDLNLSTDSIIDSENTVFDLQRDDGNHGTATLGVIGAKDNDYGVRGVSPSALLYVAPVISKNSDYNPARAINMAARRLSPGDIILIELHTWVCEQGYGPLENHPPVFDVVSQAIADGIVVVMLAGNGGVNLDDPACGGLFDRDIRDSGAIIVGAGDINLQRQNFSSYGNRVDVQGFGSHIVTTGYGDIFGFDNRDRRYTARYNGTSSAGAIVAGAIAILQGIIKADGRKPLGSKKIRQLLVDTGSWPNNQRQQLIGPLPNLSAAAETLGFNPLNSYTSPFFFSFKQGGVLSSFVRIKNKSKSPGHAEIFAFDKSGNHFGPINLSLPANKITHFSSQDLQEEIGLRGEDGVYRLTFTSSLPLELETYAQSMDGFYTNLRELAPLANLSYFLSYNFYVKIFEPPSANKATQSLLYLTNPSSAPVNITLSVQDDFGEDIFATSYIPVSLDPHSSRILTALDIQNLFEANFPGKDSDNKYGLHTDKEPIPHQNTKWELFIYSNVPVHVINLMRDPSSGHLSNLSQ